MHLTDTLCKKIQVTPNPCAAFVRNKKLNKERARVRYLSRAKTVRLLAALDAEPDRQAANALRLLLMTGARTGELLASRWSDFDLNDGRWLKPYTTTKGDEDHAVPLSA